MIAAVAVVASRLAFAHHDVLADGVNVALRDVRLGTYHPPTTVLSETADCDGFAAGGRSERVPLANRGSQVVCPDGDVGFAMPIAGFVPSMGAKDVVSSFLFVFSSRYIGVKRVQVYSLKALDEFDRRGAAENPKITFQNERRKGRTQQHGPQNDHHKMGGQSGKVATSIPHSRHG